MNFTRRSIWFCTVIMLAASLWAGTRPKPPKVRFVNAFGSSDAFTVTAQELTLDRKAKTIARNLLYTQAGKLTKLKNAGSITFTVLNGTQPFTSDTLSISTDVYAAVFGVLRPGTSLMDLFTFEWNPVFANPKETGLLTVIHAIPDVAQIDMHLTRPSITLDTTIDYKSNYSGLWTTNVPLHIQLSEHGTASVLYETDVSVIGGQNNMLVVTGTAFGADSFPIVGRVILDKSKK